MGRKLLWTFLIALGAFLYADGGFVWDIDTEPSIDDADQKAIILYNKGWETLIISISYRGIESNFAWLLPTPAPPEVSVAPRDIFNEVDRIATQIKEDVKDITLDSLPLNSGVGDVKVRERKQIGLYDIAVISSDDPNALFRWCQSQGFVISSTALPIIKYYIDRGWCFTAVRINGHGMGRMGVLEGEFAPIQLKFPSKRIVYPLKISYINRFSLSPRVAIYDEICGHPVLFGKEKEELAKKVWERVMDDITNQRQFEGSILYRLGFMELQNAYQTALMQGNPQLLQPLVELYIKEDAEKLSDKERNLLVLYVIAPFKVEIGKETNAQLSSFLEIPYSFKVKTKTIGEYLVHNGEDDFPLPKKAFITKVYGNPFFASFQDDLILVRSLESLKFSAFLIIFFGSLIFVIVGGHLQHNRLQVISEDLREELKKLKALWEERGSVIMRLMNIVFDYVKDKSLLEEIARAERLFLQGETLQEKAKWEMEMKVLLERLFKILDDLKDVKIEEASLLRERLLKMERDISLQMIKCGKLAKEYEKLSRSIPIVFFLKKESNLFT
ncbi:DUF2330 domain-containing protein [bacterium]|nr:DUF2330 domain-containing protein [bacterium]